MTRTPVGFCREGENMNRPPEDFVLVDEERLLNFSTACFQKAGITHEHAALISRLLVNSDLRGVRSHGTRTVNGYCGGFENGSFNPNPDIRIIHETPTAVVLDGNGTLGYLPTVRATEHAIAKAKEVGIGMGLVRYIGHYGSAGHYARICNENGCIGFSVSKDTRTKATLATKILNRSSATTATHPSVSLSPLVKNHQSCSTRRPALWQTIQRGTDFDALLSVIPAAFFKSIGYTAVASLLGGALTGFTEPPPEDTAKWSGSRMGGMVLAIDIESVVPTAVFNAEVDIGWCMMSAKHTNRCRGPIGHSYRVQLRQNAQHITAVKASVTVRWNRNPHVVSVND